MSENESAEVQLEANIKIYMNYIGVPVFTLICAVYVYWDELFKKINFLLLDRRIKEYKKLRMGV